MTAKRLTSQAHVKEPKRDLDSRARIINARHNFRCFICLVSFSLLAELEQTVLPVQPESEFFFFFFLLQRCGIALSFFFIFL